MSAGVLPSAKDTAEPRTVVVGYDGSDEARAAFTTAVGRAGSSGTVLAVHATRPASSWLGAPYYDRTVEERLLAGRAILDQLNDSAQRAGPTIEFELLDGSPANALMRIAAARAAHEIVVGSRGLGRARAALGSVSHSLLHAADRPVLVVPRGAVGKLVHTERIS